MVTVRGKQVHFHRIGFGEPVLLLHGNVGPGEEMIRSVTVQPGISWIAPDRPGYGFSDACRKISSARRRWRIGSTTSPKRCGSSRW
jgi:pimeloyl-ACP methyl ester carboxylesterase